MSKLFLFVVAVLGCGGTGWFMFDVVEYLNVGKYGSAFGFAVLSFICFKIGMGAVSGWLLTMRGYKW